MTEIEVMPHVERRRKWTEAERAALLAEIDAEGSVSAVARRHGIAENLLYGWRSARKAKETADPIDEPVEFVPTGVFGRATTRDRRCWPRPPRHGLGDREIQRQNQ